MVTRYDILYVSETLPAPSPQFPISHFPFRKSSPSERTFMLVVPPLSVLGDVCYPRNGPLIGRVVPQKRATAAGDVLFWRSMRHAFRRGVDVAVIHS
jgi:hypothetical protein